MILERAVLLGVDDGSPRKSMPSLSISSRRKTGFLVPARFIP
jgi:hypothetical protein